MRVEIDDLRSYMLEALAARDLTGDSAEFIVNDYVEAELEGRRTHGIGKFLLIDYALAGQEGEAEIILSTGAFAIIDGHRSLGQLVARRAAQLAISLAAEHSVGVVSVRNSSRHSRLAPYAHMIAAAGHFGIVMNNAGPPAIAPFGSRDAILGTNPIAFGFPSSTEPLIIDFATSERPWGEIRQAMLEGRTLPTGAFLDAAGNETVDPTAVEAVLAFGGYKGSAFALAIELLSLGLAGAKAGLKVQTEYDLGAVFIAIRQPQMSVEESNRSAQVLLDDIRKSRPMRAGQPVRVPGDRANALRRKNEEIGSIEIDDQTYAIVRRMARGGPGLEATNLSN